MTRIGDIIKQYDSLFDDYCSDTVTVRNYTESAQADDYGDHDKVEHPNSPQSVSGSSQVRGRPSVESGPTGLLTETDRVFFISEEAFVTTDEAMWDGTRVDYPTEVEDVDGRVYTIVSVENQRTGIYRCLGRYDD